MTKVISKLNVEDYTSSKTKLTYPNIVVEKMNLASSIIITSMESGDIPIIGTYKGVTKVIGRTKMSALSLNPLMKVTPLKLSMDESHTYRITRAEDYLEVMKEWT